MRSQVLFVDDEPLMRELYSMVGAALGDNFQITTLPTAKDALEFLQSSSVDVIVSDLAMPGMSGHELMTAVCREHPESMRILISAHDDQLTVAQSLMVAHRYFNKPFDVRNLAAVLKRIYRDEIRHVAAGSRWFRIGCESRDLAIVAHWQRMIRTHFRGMLKPPFNDSARDEAGLSREMYEGVAGQGVV